MTSVCGCIHILWSNLYFINTVIHYQFLIVVVSEIKSEVQRKNTDPLLDLSALKDGNLIEVCLFVLRLLKCTWTVIIEKIRVGVCLTPVILPYLSVCMSDMSYVAITCHCACLTQVMLPYLSVFMSDTSHLLCLTQVILSYLSLCMSDTSHVAILVSVYV